MIRDSNGVLDTEQLSEAEQAIEAAEQAKNAVDNKLAEITSDGLVNPSEKAELDRLNRSIRNGKSRSFSEIE
jgi:hypothetical protein